MYTWTQGRKINDDGGTRDSPSSSRRKADKQPTNETMDKRSHPMDRVFDETTAISTYMPSNVKGNKSE